jgi:hypothetical protein
VLRFLLWRLLGVLAALLGFALLAWLWRGGPGRALRGSAPPGGLGSSLSALLHPLGARQAASGAGWPVA